ncbi:MAG: sensor histidine kinase [Acidimicrobiia bacterium]
MAVSLTTGPTGPTGFPATGAAGAMRPPVPSDVELSLSRIRQFFRTEQLTSAVAVLTALWFRIRYVDVATGYIVLAALAVPVVVTEWCLRRLRADNLVSNVLVMLALFWISTLILAPLAPFALPLMPFAVLVPLLAAGPVFDGRHLRVLIAAGTLVMAAIAALAVLPGYDGIERQLPAGLQHGVVITGLALRIVTASFAVLDTNRRRSASLAALAGANEALRESRRRLVTVADEERRRIERDLHDGAQQHLVALALRLRLLATAHPDTSDDITVLAADLGRAIDDLRELAHGIYPPLLERRGLADAVAAAARRSPLHTDVAAAGLGRYPPAIESAVYFCCLEAMQNAAKHAGADARVSVTLAATGEGLSFEVRDNGPGVADAAVAAAGHGLRNMADRLAAVGAELRLDSPPGGGLALRALVPHLPVHDQPALDRGPVMGVVPAPPP